MIFVCKKNWFARLLNLYVYLMDETCPVCAITSFNTPETTESLSNSFHYNTKLLEANRLGLLVRRVDIKFCFSFADCNTHCFDSAISCDGHHVTAHDGMDSGMRWSHGTVRERTPTAPNHRVEAVSIKNVGQPALHMILL